MIAGEGVALVNAAEARALIGERLASRRWWVLPWLSERAVAVSVALEAKHYVGTATVGFEVVTQPVPGIFALSLAEKRYCSPKQLAALLVRMGSAERRAKLARDFASRDVPVLGNPRETVPLLEAFRQWLTADPLARYWRERRN